MGSLRINLQLFSLPTIIIVNQHSYIITSLCNSLQQYLIQYNQLFSRITLNGVFWNHEDLAACERRGTCSDKSHNVPHISVRRATRVTQNLSSSLSMMTSPGHTGHVAPAARLRLVRRLSQTSWHGGLALPIGTGLCSVRVSCVLVRKSSREVIFHHLVLQKSESWSRVPVLRSRGV